MDGFSLLVASIKGFLTGMLLTWPVWALIGAIFIAKVAWRIYEKRRLAGSGIDEIDQMDGRMFEKYLEVLFEGLGYRVELTRAVGDYGADLVTHRDGVRTVIQAKRYRGKVGIKAVQEAVAAKGPYRCQAAMVVTNSYYTLQAQKLAESNNVQLWNRDDLVRALLSVKPQVPSTPATNPLPAAATPSAPLSTLVTTSPDAGARVSTTAGERCIVCSKVVSARVAEYCRTNASRFEGQIYCYDHQRNRKSTSDRVAR